MNRITSNTDLNLRQRLNADGLARLISDLLNPLLFPPIVLGLTGWLLHLSAPIIGWIVGTSLLFYTIIPFLATIYLLKQNHIASYDLPRRNSRHRLFIISIASAFVAFLCINLMSYFTGSVLSVIALVLLINTIIGSLVNLAWKISIHTAALTTAGTIILFYAQTGLIALSTSYIFSLTVLLLLLPLMIWARLQLRVHTLAELFGGALAGFVFTILELSMLTNLW